VSDYAINNLSGGNVGKRVRVVMAYLVGVASMLFAFKTVPASYALLQSAIVFSIGFFLYGPQMLIGLCGAEIVGRKSVGASEGFLGWVAYLGAANAGIPLSLLVNKFGWDAFFTALFGACALAILLLIPAFNAPSEVQRQEQKQQLKAAAAA
jgi:sugar phosphate permease